MHSSTMNSWKRGLLRIVAILSAFCCFSAGAEEVYTLPMDLTPGTPLRQECYTSDTSYQDPTITMEITKGFDYETVWWMAEVEIAHPSQLRTMPAYNFTYSGTTKGSKLSRRAQAVLAVDGDYFGRDVNTKGSYVLRQGELYSQHLTGKSDILLIDEAGDFHIVKKAQEGDIPAEFDGKKAVNGLCFGPALVENGEVCRIEPDDFMITEKKVGRVALCQMGPLHYAVICCSVPTTDSLGMTLQDFASLTGKLGAVWAYNLDGGNSAMMFTGSKMINVNRTIREISDIVYFASAWPEGKALP